MRKTLRNTIACSIIAGSLLISGCYEKGKSYNQQSKMYKTLTKILEKNKSFWDNLVMIPLKLIPEDWIEEKNQQLEKMLGRY